MHDELLTNVVQKMSFRKYKSGDRLSRSGIDRITDV